MDHGSLAHGIIPPPKAIRSSTMEIKKFRFATNKKGRLSPKAHAQFTDDALEVVTRQVLRRRFDNQVEESTTVLALLHIDFRAAVAFERMDQNLKQRPY